MNIAVVLLADTESPGDMGRAVNALETAREALQAGDDVQIIFDGAATKWIGLLADEDNDYHELYDEVAEAVTGACQFCANAYGVRTQVEKAEVPLLDEHDGHPSFRTLLAEDYQVLTF